MQATWPSPVFAIAVAWWQRILLGFSDEVKLDDNFLN